MAPKRASSKRSSRRSSDASDASGAFPAESVFSAEPGLTDVTTATADQYVRFERHAAGQTSDVPQHIYDFSASLNSTLESKRPDVQDLKKRGVEPLVIKQWPDDWLRWLFDFCHKKTGKGNPVHHVMPYPENMTNDEKILAREMRTRTLSRFRTRDSRGDNSSSIAVAGSIAPTAFDMAHRITDIQQRGRRRSAGSPATKKRNSKKPCTPKKKNTDPSYHDGSDASSDDSTYDGNDDQESTRARGHHDHHGHDSDEDSFGSYHSGTSDDELVTGNEAGMNGPLFTEADYFPMVAAAHAAMAMTSVPPGAPMMGQYYEANGMLYNGPGPVITTSSTSSASASAMLHDPNFGMTLSRGGSAQTLAGITPYPGMFGNTANTTNGYPFYYAQQPPAAAPGFYAVKNSNSQTNTWESMSLVTPLLQQQHQQYLYQQASVSQIQQPQPQVVPQQQAFQQQDPTSSETGTASDQAAPASAANGMIFVKSEGGATTATSFSAPPILHSDSFSGLIAYPASIVSSSSAVAPAPAVAAAAAAAATATAPAAALSAVAPAVVQQHQIGT